MTRACSMEEVFNRITFKHMKRNSPNDFSCLTDLSHLDEKLVDKRQEKRANVKRLRRNRHYEKQFLKLANRLEFD